MLSTIVDVAIGLIFIYLLLSLMCSAANEIIELMLKKRAIDLERGIREMLAPGSESGTPDIIQKLYNHPLINNLFGEHYEDSGIASGARKIWRTGLPSYIPARSFALALMDLVTIPEPAEGASAAPPPPSGATGATPSANFEVKLTAPPPPRAAPGDVDNPLTRLREAIATSPLFPDLPLSSPLSEARPNPKQALIALLDAAGDDVAKARENIETWFNSSMDRVSSWYKRRTQVVILILGLLVAVLANADSITIAKRLSTDRALRESLVAASVEYAKANASPAASPTPASSVSESTSPATPPECEKAPQSQKCEDKKKLQEACKNPDSPKCKYFTNQDQLNALGLPIGWDHDRRKEFSDSIFQHIFGWLLTALAISLGAPFWFDLLNKFIVIRSAVKPHEKSPEEESKD